MRADACSDRIVWCSRDAEADSHHLDHVTVTAASGADVVLFIVWERASGVGLVWGKPMHEDLGVAAGSGPAWPTAQEQLKRLGARLCKPAEKRLLARPGVGTTRRDVLMVSINAACQWLRSVGEQTAAKQLSQRQQPLLTASPASAAAQQGVHLDSAALKTATGDTCELAIIRQHSSDTGVLWAKQLFVSLDVAASSGMTWSEAYGALKRLGARVGRSAELRLLRTLRCARGLKHNVLLLGLDSACQWLRDAGRPDAAAQLLQSQQAWLAGQHGRAVQQLSPALVTPEQVADAAGAQLRPLKCTSGARTGNDGRGQVSAPNVPAV